MCVAQGTLRPMLHVRLLLEGQAAAWEYLTCHSNHEGERGAGNYGSAAAAAAAVVVAFAAADCTSAELVPWQADQCPMMSEKSHCPILLQCSAQHSTSQASLTVMQKYICIVPSCHLCRPW